MADRSPIPLPSVEELNRIFRYDSETGELIWRARDEMPPQWNGKHAGKTTRPATTQRYARVCIQRRSYYAHRIIFKMLNGFEPPIVDHKNRDTSHNFGPNLRAATNSLNLANSKDRNRDLPRGVYRVPGSKIYPFNAIQGHTYLGKFKTAEEASAAFKAAILAKYGEFAA